MRVGQIRDGRVDHAGEVCLDRIRHLLQRRQAT